MTPVKRPGTITVSVLGGGGGGGGPGQAFAVQHLPDGSLGAFRTTLGVDSCSPTETVKITWDAYRNEFVRERIPWAADGGPQEAQWSLDEKVRRFSEQPTYVQLKYFFLGVSNVSVYNCPVSERVPQFSQGQTWANTGRAFYPYYPTANFFMHVHEEATKHVETTGRPVALVVTQTGEIFMYDAPVTAEDLLERLDLLQSELSEPSVQVVSSSP